VTDLARGQGKRSPATQPASVSSQYTGGCSPASWLCNVDYGDCSGGCTIYKGKIVSCN
jgi:hypothetical protein